MRPRRLNRSTLTEQVAGLLRDGLRAGRWRTRMPGQGALSKEFGVSGATVYGAMRTLIDEGLLVSGGNGRGALISAKASQGVSARAPKRVIRVAILGMLPVDDMYPGNYLDMTRLARDLENEGHAVTLVGFSKGKRLGTTGNLANLLRETDADVWLIYQGTHEVLEWFMRKGIPALALGGRTQALPIPVIAGRLTGCLVRAVNRLTELGHRRIVFITPESWRGPTTGAVVKEFIRALESAGIRTSEFNVPAWDESREGLARLLDALFRVTPPTALICTAPHATEGVLGWLLAHGLRVPADVSLIVHGMDVGAAWCVPGLDVVGMEMDVPSYRRRIREWVAEVAEGRVKQETTYFDLELTEGNSMGPPPAGGL